MPKTLWRLMGAMAGIIVVVIASLQNRQPVQLHLYFWILPHVPLVLLVLLAMLVGVAIGAIGMWWDRQRGDRRAGLTKGLGRAGRTIASPAGGATNPGQSSSAGASSPQPGARAGDSHPPDDAPPPRA